MSYLTLKSEMRNVPVGHYLFELLFFKIRRRKGYKVVIFFFTLLIYTAFHMSRKPISVVKSVLHRNCSEYAQDHNMIVTKNNDSFCDWMPFDGENWTDLFAYLDATYLLSYACSMFISGHIAERVNIRYFLTIGMLLCGFTTSLFGLAFYLNIHVFYYFVIVQILAGMVQATGWPSVVACIGNWFGKSKRGFLMGLWNSHTSLGNIFGSVIAGAFVTEAWGLSFIVPGAIVASMGIVVFLFLTPYPEDVNCQSAKHNTQIMGSIHSAVAISFTGSDSQIPSLDSSTKSLDSIGSSSASPTDPILPKPGAEKSISIFQALCIPGVVEYSLCLFFAKLVSYTFLFWLPSYIKYKGFNPSEAADLSAIMDGGGIIGGIIAGVINDISGASALTCSGMLILAVPYLYLYYCFGANNLPICIVLLIVLGILVNGPYALITTAVSADLGTHECLKGNAKAVATVTAIIDGTGSLGAALGPFLTGLIVRRFSWVYVFVMLMVATTLAAILLIRRVIKEIIFLLKERRRRLQDKFYKDNDYA